MDTPLTVFVDESCPVCSREVRWLKRRDGASRLRLVDISASTFDAEREAGTGHLSLMRRIHGRTRDGQVVVGVEVFRQIYAELGFVRLVALSRLPIVRPLLDAAYAVFAWARFRWALTCSVSAGSLPVRDNRSPEKVQVS